MDCEDCVDCEDCEDRENCEDRERGISVSSNVDNHRRSAVRVIKDQL